MIRNSIKTLYYILTITSLTFIFLKNASAKIIFEDDFSNTDAQGNPLTWNEFSNPDASTVINGEYILTVSSGQQLAYTYVGNQNWKTQSFSVDVKGLSGPDRFLLFRFDNNRPGRKGYVIKWYESFYQDKFEIYGLNNCTNTLFSYDSHLGETHRIKVSGMNNNFINVFFEDKLVLSCDDPDPILTGGVGFHQQSSGSVDPETNQLYLNSVSYDNVLVEGVTDSGFNLPFYYRFRNHPSQLEFQSAFWKKLTAAFDHSKLGNVYIPFTSDSYNKKSCPKGTIGITCYDSHNGTDFAPSSQGSKDNVYPAADGEVVYASDYDKNRKCNPSKSGYGCVVIIYHPDLDVYTLYAHLSEIIVSVNDSVSYQDIIGKMGNTGCGPTCGIHIHLGVMKDKTPLLQKSKINISDWENLLKQLEPLKISSVDTPPKHYCTYRLTNGNILSFQDPSGWSSKSKPDPWSLSFELGSCATESPYLWMHDIGTTKPNFLINDFWFSENIN